MTAVSINVKFQMKTSYCFNEAFAKKFMKKLSVFNMDFWNLFQDLLFC